MGNGAPAPASDGAATNPPAEQTPAADQEREQQALRNALHFLAPEPTRRQPQSMSPTFVLALKLTRTPCPKLRSHVSVALSYLATPAGAPSGLS